MVAGDSLCPPLDTSVDVNIELWVIQQGRLVQPQPDERCKWRRRTVELPPAMVREDHAGRAKLLGKLDVGDAGDALNEDW